MPFSGFWVTGSAAGRTWDTCQSIESKVPICGLILYETYKFFIALIEPGLVSNANLVKPCIFGSGLGKIHIAVFICFENISEDRIRRNLILSYTSKEDKVLVSIYFSPLRMIAEFAPIQIYENKYENAIPENTTHEIMKLRVRATKMYETNIESRKLSRTQNWSM
jgi:hypothetical protein